MTALDQSRIGSTSNAPRVAVHLAPVDIERALRRDVLEGFTAHPKELSPKWLYDDRGCDLFDQITRLPEYYPTRCERSILVSAAPHIAALSDADTLVELGSGTSDKTRLLLDALRDAGTLQRFAPFDVAEATLRDATRIGRAYPEVQVDAVVGDFERHLRHLPSGGRRLIAFLGGTIGNLAPAPRASLLSELARQMAPGDAFLVGTDLIKDRRRLLAAYDDAAGVTAAFDLNVLAMINRELGGHFDLASFDHVACYDEEEHRIEMGLRSKTNQRIPIDALRLDVEFASGEDVRTEISTKFTLPLVHSDLAAAGLETVRSWTDHAGDFALTLAVR